MISVNVTPTPLLSLLTARTARWRTHRCNGLVPVHRRADPVPDHRRNCLALEEEDMLEEEEKEGEEEVVVAGDDCGHDANTAPVTTQRHDGPVASPFS